jgi:hypothetical protein
LVQKITQTDQDLRKQFVLEILYHIEEDMTYLNRIYSSDKATFHMCGTMNRHNCHIWGSKNNPHEVTEHERDSSKVNI